MTNEAIKNRIDISITFDFKGERFTPTATIELDDFITLESGLPHFHQILAQRNNIDLMSYQYEIMLEDRIQVSNAKGLVADFVSDGQLDEEAFLQARHELDMFEQLQTIAQTHLAVDDLEKNPALKKALAEAFNLGKETQ
jgi:hypothetical protein